jgi:signal transduction histidine kinase
MWEERVVSTESQANVLIVDDDRKALLAMQELLQSSEYRIVLANSGDEALRCVLREEFAVILLDARMPEIDGFAAAKLIRERPRSRHTPIIFLTGAYQDPSSMFRGYEAGAVDYIVKPLAPEVLKSKIAVFVELYNKNAALMREVAERKRAEEHLRTSQENLRALAAHLQSVREEERTRIAREIHDHLGQALTAIKMDLTWIGNRLSASQKALMTKVKGTFRLIDEAVQSVRKLATELRPEVLDELGLSAAIKWQTKEFQKRAGIRCSVTLESDSFEVDRERSTATFRIFQELLTNIARHANATKVNVQVRADGGILELVVEDDGEGIAEAEVDNPKSLGLLGIRERVLPFGGKVSILGTRKQGTKVTISLPLVSGAGDEAKRQELRR